MTHHRLGHTFEASSSARGQTRKGRKQDREAASWVRGLCARRVILQDAERKLWWRQTVREQR